MEIGRSVFGCLGDKTAYFLNYAQHGSSFVFGDFLVKSEGVFAFAVSTWHRHEIYTIDRVREEIWMTLHANDLFGFLRVDRCCRWSTSSALSYRFCITGAPCSGRWRNWAGFCKRCSVRLCARALPRPAISFWVWLSRRCLYGHMSRYVWWPVEVWSLPSSILTDPLTWFCSISRHRRSTR